MVEGKEPEKLMEKLSDKLEGFLKYGMKLENLSVGKEKNLTIFQFPLSTNADLELRFFVNDLESIIVIFISFYLF